MSDEIKALLEEQGQTFEAVKGSIERLDGRCDAIETAFKRTPKTIGGNDPTLEAKQANKFAALVKGEPLMARSETGGMDLNGYRGEVEITLLGRVRVMRPTFQALAEMNVLGMVVFGVLLGISIALIGDAAEPLKRFFDALTLCLKCLSLA